VQAIEFSLSVDWLQSTMELIWQPLLLGLLIVATLSALLGYYGVHMLWRLHIIQRLKARRQRRYSHSDPADDKQKKNSPDD
ncbi:MAG: DUF2062 domain-containing protein, partial [Thiolinea sp.]